MRVSDIRERTVPVSRYADPGMPSGGLNTTVVALLTDVRRDGAPIVGFGFSSVGRFGQSGLIRERFAPRLLAAREDEIATESGDNLDPVRAWDCMMQDEKPGGHGERCVAVGTLDMALWDAAAKIAGKPLCRFLGDRVGTDVTRTAVPVYAGGGYYFPTNDIARLTDEVRQFLDQGHTRVKIKIGGRSLAEDLKRIEDASLSHDDPGTRRSSGPEVRPHAHHPAKAGGWFLGRRSRREYVGPRAGAGMRPCVPTAGDARDGLRRRRRCHAMP